MKKKMYFGIISIYVSLFFVILSRLFYNTRIYISMKTTLEDSGIWFEKMPFIIRFAIWLPAIIGLVFIIIYFKNLYDLRKKNKEDTKKV